MTIVFLCHYLYKLSCKLNNLLCLGESFSHMETRFLQWQKWLFLTEQGSVGLSGRRLLLHRASCHCSSQECLQSRRHMDSQTNTNIFYCLKQNLRSSVRRCSQTSRGTALGPLVPLSPSLNLSPMCWIQPIPNKRVEDLQHSYSSGLLELYVYSVIYLWTGWSMRGKNKGRFSSVFEI